MPHHQPPTAGPDDAPWSALYEQAADRYSDLVTEVRDMVEHGVHDPEGSTEMACAAAETAGAAARALSDPWSLYTTRDAATVASALFVQLRHGADALRELALATGRIAERGEAGPSADLDDALEALRSASETVHGLVARHAATTVRALHATPCSAPVPADVHRTVVAVAALLDARHDGAVTLNTRHEDGAYDPDDDEGFGCGCDVTIVADHDTYTFHRGDSEWSVVKKSDGVAGPGGSVHYSTWIGLSTRLETAHPQQLADEILSLVAHDRDEARSSDGAPVPAPAGTL
ncbi:hypothetical protein ACF08W_23505 [Streptomyces sp. NPDC015144]|uniref:hypothetical protein n=1 Tax=Streptomyces sp. NPDC015144 TaxID=3364944 RepID=UPI003702298A